ncbi:ABC transporter ATP-binding protein [Aerococcus urinae]|nr:ABC transporter ATP-binding protein [Aerococcus loyolae]MDK6908191.1 ABC transporter ATP-binding protein [Aerococcus urinae]
MSEDEIMLSVNHLSFAYQGHTVFEDISYDFSKGQVIGLMGANGTGKTTLMRILTGLIPVEKGMVVFQGQPLSYKKKDLYQLRQAVNMVFQDPNQQLFYPTVQDDVAFALHNLKRDPAEIKARVASALKALAIDHLATRPIQTLSYGQKKRVALAGILVIQPAMILLDEPTVGLDPAGVKDLTKIIQDLVKEGHRFLISSHDMAFLYQLCDQYLAIADKGIVAQGDSEAVFKSEAFMESIGLELPWQVRLLDE